MQQGDLDDWDPMFQCVHEHSLISETLRVSGRTEQTQLASFGRESADRLRRTCRDQSA